MNAVEEPAGFYLPIMLDVRGRPCLVVGGGAVAARKVASLLDGGAAVTVISPEVVPEIAAWRDAGRLHHLDREWEEGDSRGYFLVVSATDDEEINRLVAEEAEAERTLVNVVDSPRLSSFIAPAVLRRGSLVVAVSTSGASPAAARRIKEKLEELLGPEHGRFLRVMALLRPRVLAAEADEARRKEIFERLADSDLLDALRADDRARVLAAAGAILGPEEAFWLDGQEW